MLAAACSASTSVSHRILLTSAAIAAAYPAVGFHRRGGASTIVRLSFGASAVIIASSASSRCSASRGPPAVAPAPRASSRCTTASDTSASACPDSAGSGDTPLGVRPFCSLAPRGSAVGSSTTAVAPCATTSSSAVSVSWPSGGQDTLVDGCTPRTRAVSSRSGVWNWPSDALPPRSSATRSGSAYGVATSRCFGAIARSRASHCLAAAAPVPATVVFAEVSTR